MPVAAKVATVARQYSPIGVKRPVGLRPGAATGSPSGGRRLGRRLVQLYAGLLLYGVSDSMLVLAGLGVDPWDVLHQGISRLAGIPIGTVAILVGLLVLLIWIPFRQRPGIGTSSNMVLIGLVRDVVLAVVPAPVSPVPRWTDMGVGILLNGVATGCYIGAGLGPGPRDGLMTALAGRGYSIRVVRTGIEATVVLVGWLLGGTVGIGTLAYTVSIGPLAHVLIPVLSLAPEKRRSRRSRSTGQTAQAESRSPGRGIGLGHDGRPGALRSGNHTDVV